MNESLRESAWAYYTYPVFVVYASKQIEGVSLPLSKQFPLAPAHCAI